MVGTLVVRFSVLLLPFAEAEDFYDGAPGSHPDTSLGKLRHLRVVAPGADSAPPFVFLLNVCRLLHLFLPNASWAENSDEAALHRPG